MAAPAREFFQTKLLAGIAHQQPIDFDQFAGALRQLNEHLATLDLAVYFDDLSRRLGEGFVALHDHLNEVARRVEDKVDKSTKKIIDLSHPL